MRMAMHRRILLVIRLCCLPAFLNAQTGNSGLDPSFGKGGVLIDTSYTSYGEINDIKLRPDGKIMVLIGGNGTYVARYHPNGMVDSSFGTNGNRRIDSFAKPKGLNGIAFELQQDGMIIVAGRTHEWIGHAVQGGFLMRIDEDGAVDSAFGNNGVQYTKDETTLLCLKPDGSILTAGHGPDRDIVRVNSFKANGAVDSTFGVNGIFQVKPGSYPSLARLSTLTNGKIAIVGSVRTKVYYTLLFANGQLDTTFCGTGVCYTYGGWGSEDAIVYPNGETLVAIEWSVGDSPAIMRLKKDDAMPDSTFGPSGDGLFYIPLPGLDIRTMLQSPDGYIICAGMWNEHFTVIRVLPDGRGMDTTFGNGGIITTSLGGAHYERIYTAALQPDGKILAGGTFRVLESNPRYWHHVSAVVRYFSDARLGVTEAPQSAKRTLRLYPNPASTSLTVTLPAPGLLQLFGMEGRLLQEQRSTRPTQVLDIASLPQGVYLLRLQTADFVYSGRVMKE